MQGPSVLVVEEDRVFGGQLVRCMGLQGLEAQLVPERDSLWTRLAQAPADLVVMDVSSSGVDGLQQTRVFRRQSRRPLILMSARADHSDRVLGLECGADDFLTKPFEPRELVARIQAILRRTCPHKPAVTWATGCRIRLGDWEVEPAAGCLWDAAGRRVPLSPAECLLLLTFLRSPGRLLRREQIRQAVSGGAWHGGERSVDLLVARLRQKLGAVRDGGDPIRTIRGHGYLFDGQPAQRCPG
jgi:two-component system OmpR family response regulator